MLLRGESRAYPNRFFERVEGACFAREYSRKWRLTCAGCDQPPKKSPYSARVYLVPRIPEGVANRYRQYRDKTNVMGYVLANEKDRRAGVIYVAREAA
jgi:hypothetical protein